MRPFIVASSSKGYAAVSIMTVRPQFAVAVAFFTAIFVTAVLPSRGPRPAQGLPVVERPSSIRSDTLAVLITGDGGWRAIDRDLATDLNAHGVSVVGLVSPDYFSVRRTASESAKALDSLIREYGRRWHRSRVILIGYSRGAGVLPFMVSRLPAAERSEISVIGLLGLDPGIDFHYSPKVLLWQADDDLYIPVQPELRKIRDERVLCVAGRDDTDAVCRSLSPALVETYIVPGGHHFGGSYRLIADRILREAHIHA
jgi:type IV secretory pathway VirJ component